MISRPLALTFAGFAALGAAVLGAFVYERTHVAAAPTRLTVARIAVTPAQPPLATAGPATGTVPTLRPLFALPDLAGKTHSISEWDGQPLYEQGAPDDPDVHNRADIAAVYAR